MEYVLLPLVILFFKSFVIHAVSIYVTYGWNIITFKLVNNLVHPFAILYLLKSNQVLVTKWDSLEMDCVKSAVV